MDWINLHISILDSEEFLGEEPTNQATWLKLLRYCIGQENSGVIQNCKTWKDRKWQQIVRVTQAETQASSALWAWEGDSLRVLFYPVEKEAIVKGARVGGAKKTQAKTQASRDNGKQGGRPKNPSLTQGKPNIKEGKGIGKERKGIEEAAPMALNGFHLENKQSFEIPTIVSLYPRQQRVAEACDEVRKHIAGGVKPEAIIAGTRAIASVIPQMPSGHLNKFVPSALTFFRDRRWEDDPLTWLRNASGPNGATHTDTPQITGRKANTIRIPS